MSWKKVRTVMNCGDKKAAVNKKFTKRYAYFCCDKKKKVLQERYRADFCMIAGTDQITGPGQE